MGGDDSQKLLPWRETIFPSRAQTSGSHYEINNVAETAAGISHRLYCWSITKWPQLPPAWVIFGKHRRVSSAARRSMARIVADLTSEGWKFSATDLAFLSPYQTST